MSFLTTEHMALLGRTILQKYTDDEKALFFATVERTQLDPFARQIWPQGRWDGKAQREVMSILITIDGMRSIAERTGDYEGQLGPFWCDKDGKWVDVWVADHFPHAGRVGVMRRGFREPLWAVARFDAYKAMVNEKNNKGVVTGKKVNDVWARMPDLMVAKCAEALALRRAFPNQLGGLYTEEEFQQALEEAKEEGAAGAATGTLAPARKEPAPQADAPAPAPAADPAPQPPEVDAAMHPEDVAAAAADAEKSAPAPARAPAAAPAPAAPSASGAHKVDLPPGPYGVLTSKLATAGLTEEALLAGIGKDVSIKTVNEAFAWIKQHAKQ